MNFDTDKLMGRFFRPVDGVVWDLMSGKVGVETGEGIMSLEATPSEDGSTTEYGLVVNVFDQFGMGVPAFAQNTPIADVNEGDLVYNKSGAFGWVTAKKDKSFSVLKLDGTISNWQPPKVPVLGFEGAHGVMVIRSLLNILPTGNSGLSSMQGMLMPMMMMGGGGDLSQLMPMMLMSQMGATGVEADGSESANPLGGMNMGSMMQTMMMMKMMGGGKDSSSSPFGDMGNFFDRKSN